MNIFDALLGGVSSLVNSGIAIQNSIDAKNMAEKNYQFQVDTQNYQKEMQRTAWSREDSAIQRRVADLKAAGLSPVLAAGSAAQSSSPIQVITPQKQFAPMNADVVASMNMMKMAQDISMTDSQQALLEIQKDSMLKDVEGKAIANKMANIQLQTALRQGVTSFTSMGQKEQLEFIDSLFPNLSPTARAPLAAILNKIGQGIGVAKELLK